MESHLEVMKKEMLKFNTFLELSGLNPERVRLVRHVESRVKVSLWNMWLHKRDDFELYQSLQTPNKFGDSDYLADFVVNTIGETVFVGFYEIKGKHPVPAGIQCPVHKDRVDYSKYNQFDLGLTEHLKEYCGRLVIEWGEGKLAWVQKAGLQNKEVLELRREIKDPDFPGYFKFSHQIDDLENLPHSWITALKSIFGVYLLVNSDTGKQYIGSAYGEEGLWGRWQAYVKTGHGNNEGIKRSRTNNFQVSILEVVPPSTHPDEIIKRESIWKDKLLSRKFGLNEN